VKEVLSYGLAFAGLIVTAIAVAAIVGKQKYAAMHPMIVHMLRTGSQRAEMMCHNGKGTFLESLGASITAGALTYSREAAVIAQGTRLAYDAASKPVALHWTQVLKRTRTGLALAVGGAALAILVDAPATVQIVIAIACAIAALLVLVHKLDVDRSLVLGRAQVLPEVERMFVEGRYAYAAQPEPAAR
jgi:hypothetical protein